MISAYIIWATDLTVSERSKLTEKAGTVEYAQLEDKGPPNAKHVHCCDSFKNTPLLQKALLSLWL